MNTEYSGIWSRRPGLRVLPDELHAHAAGIEDEHRLRVLRAQLRDLGLVVGLAELGVDLLDDVALVVALEARHHVLAGLVVRREHVQVVDALSCRNLPIASGVWSLFQEVEKYSSLHWLPASGLAPALVPTMILPAPVTTGITAIITFDQMMPAMKSTCSRA